MRSVRGRLEGGDLHFLHPLGFLLQTPAWRHRRVSQCVRAIVWMCAQVWWRQRHRKSCSYVIFIIFAPFFARHEEDLQSCRCRCSKMFRRFSFTASQWEAAGELRRPPRQQQPRWTESRSPRPCLLTHAFFLIFFFFKSRMRFKLRDSELTKQLTCMSF